MMPKYDGIKTSYSRTIKPPSSHILFHHIWSLRLNYGNFQRTKPTILWMSSEDEVSFSLKLRLLLYFCDSLNLSIMYMVYTGASLNWSMPSWTGLCEQMWPSSESSPSSGNSSRPGKPSDGFTGVCTAICGCCGCWTVVAIVSLPPSDTT